MTKTLYAEFTVKAGSETRVAEMMRNADRIDVRNEPGNGLFLPYTRETNPREYFVFEVYRDEQAFQEHISADYGAGVQRRTCRPHRRRRFRPDLAAAHCQQPDGKGTVRRGGIRRARPLLREVLLPAVLHRLSAAENIDACHAGSR